MELQVYEDLFKSVDDWSALSKYAKRYKKDLYLYMRKAGQRWFCLGWTNKALSPYDIEAENDNYSVITLESIIGMIDDLVLLKNNDTGHYGMYYSNLIEAIKLLEEKKDNQVIFYYGNGIFGLMSKELVSYCFDTKEYRIGIPLND